MYMANDAGQEARDKYGMMKVMRESATKISPKQWEATLKDHAAFLAGGGGGGKWQTMSVGEGPGGLVLGVYLGPKSELGKQAAVSQSNLEDLDLKRVELPYANILGVKCCKRDFEGANLEGSLFTDSDFTGTSFKNANVSKADFSRSVMVDCDFTGANVTGTDFENVDLTNAKGLQK